MLFGVLIAFLLPSLTVMSMRKEDGDGGHTEHQVPPEPQLLIRVRERKEEPLHDMAPLSHTECLE